MTLEQALRHTYEWLVAQRAPILIAGFVLPVVGTALARIGKAGRTDADGRLIASVVVGVALLAFMLEVVALALAKAFLGLQLVQADLYLLAAPVVCLAGCLLGIRWVFPLSQLASVRTFADIGLFVLACVAVVWLFAKFRGWGLFFVGGIGQLLVLGAMLAVLLHRLYRRAFG